MDGQALDLPDAAFDAVFSIFGVIMFPDWRKGLAEMARVTRPGGTAWSRPGRPRRGDLPAARPDPSAKLFPDREWALAMPEGGAGLSEPAGLRPRD
jgi:SAM-dependent methyltransferase